MDKDFARLRFTPAPTGPDPSRLVPPPGGGLVPPPGGGLVPPPVTSSPSRYADAAHARAHVPLRAASGSAFEQQASQAPRVALPPPPRQNYKVLAAEPLRVILLICWDMNCSRPAFMKNPRVNRLNYLNGGKWQWIERGPVCPMVVEM